jgi:hypothetical protein
MIDLLKQVYATLTSTEAAVATATFLAGLIPILLKLSALLKLDVKKLPAWAQPIPGFVLATAGALIEQVNAGSTIWDFVLVLAFGWLGGNGVYHVAKRWTPGSGSKTAAALLLLVALPSMTACTASLEEAKLAGLNPQARATATPPNARCRSLDNEHRWWGGVAQTTAVLAGAEGISTWPVEGKKAETALAIGAGVTAAVAAGSAYLSGQASESWARECQ